MKRIEVTDRAAAMIAECRNETELNAKKAIICDLLCSMIDGSDESGTDAGEYLPLMAVVSDYVELLNELSKE